MRVADRNHVIEAILIAAGTSLAVKLIEIFSRKFESSNPKLKCPKCSARLRVVDATKTWVVVCDTCGYRVETKKDKEEPAKKEGE